MDIDAINDNIEELESSSTTFENAQELAILYIVRDHLQNSQIRNDNDEIKEEYEDILPRYRQYVDLKRRYQLGEVQDKEIHKSIKCVCKEIYEFIHTLYSCTDMPKERQYIRDMIGKLNDL